MNIDTLVESFYNKAKDEDLINEVMKLLLVEKSKTSPAEARRSRTVRFPLIIPAEQSVGQYTTDEGSEDRRTFELWMSRLGTEGGDLADKIKSIQAFINNPPADAPLAKTLSYLMFLQTFSFMIREFNASVAGFLWEPFLAAMFGGESVQVHTEEGDIADVKLQVVRDGVTMRVSLKILRDSGLVGGSFQDLVNHFAENPGQPMVYVVIRKLATTGKDGETIKDSHMVFWEFEISEETFFEYIGHPKRRKEFVEASYDTVVPVDETASKLKAILRRTDDWAAQKYEPGSKVKAILNPENNQPVGGRLPVGAPIKVVVDSVIYVPGEPGAGTKLSANANHIWGNDKEYAQWFDLWQRLKAENKMQNFWKAVQGPSPKGASKGSGASGPIWAPDGARGYVQSEQFEINANYQSAIAENLGTIDITPSKLDEAFAIGAAAIGEEMTDMFNAVTALSENVGRFFLIDCGDSAGEAQTCDENDAATRTTAGHAAIQDADTLKRVVDSRIAPALKEIE